MTTQEMVAKFNPANAQNLTAEDILDMQALNDAQIDALAAAYPNQPTRKPYLVLFDKSTDVKRQLYPLSTWQSLKNVRKFANKKNLVAYTFRELFNAKLPMTAGSPSRRAMMSPAKSVQSDLTAEQAAAELRLALSTKKADGEPAAKTAGKAKEKAPAKTAAPAKNVKAATTKVDPAKKVAVNAPRAKKVNAKKEEVAEGSKKVPEDQQFNDGLGAE